MRKRKVERGAVKSPYQREREREGRRGGRGGGLLHRVKERKEEEGGEGDD